MLGAEQNWIVGVNFGRRSGVKILSRLTHDCHQVPQPDEPTRACDIHSNSMIEAASTSRHALQSLHATRSIGAQHDRICDDKALNIIR
jgi:hypothetical protein